MRACVIAVLQQTKNKGKTQRKAVCTYIHMYVFIFICIPCTYEYFYTHILHFLSPHSAFSTYALSHQPCGV